jgi:hypothetical protein
MARHRDFLVASAKPPYAYLLFRRERLDHPREPDEELDLIRRLLGDALKCFRSCLLLIRSESAKGDTAEEFLKKIKRELSPAAMSELL